jgi:hypothetical protein
MTLALGEAAEENIIQTIEGRLLNTKNPDFTIQKK